MLYPYITLGDGTEILHTQIIKKGDVDTVEVQFEKPIETGFKSARCVLPTYKWIKWEGYSDEELAFFIKLVEHNAHLIYEFARVGGAASA